MGRMSRKASTTPISLSTFSTKCERNLAASWPTGSQTISISQRLAPIVSRQARKNGQPKHRHANRELVGALNAFWPTWNRGCKFLTANGPVQRLWQIGFINAASPTSISRAVCSTNAEDSIWIVSQMTNWLPSRRIISSASFKATETRSNSRSKHRNRKRKSAHVAQHKQDQHYLMRSMKSKHPKSH